MEKKESGLTNLLVIIMSIIFGGMSALMIFVEGIAIEYLIYAVCTAAVITGIVMIVRYFMTDAYKNINAYGFSIGTLIVILGICGLLRVKAMTGAFMVIIGIVLLLAGIIILQHSLDLVRMKDFMRVPGLILAVIVLISSIMVILQPFKDKLDYVSYIWWITLVASGISLIIDIYTLIKVKLNSKKEKKLAEKAAAEEAKAQEAAEEAKAQVAAEEAKAQAAAEEAKAQAAAEEAPMISLTSETTIEQEAKVPDTTEEPRE